MPLPLWTLLDDGPPQPQIGVRRYVMEVWGTENLDTVGLGDNPLDLDTLVNSCPPQYGHPHPDPVLTGAIVRSKKLIYGPIHNRAKVAVVYDSQVQFRFGNYTARSVEGATDLIPHYIPVCTQYTSRMASWGVRSRTMRRVVIFSGSLDPDKVQHRIEQNAGCWYFFLTATPVLPDFSVDGDQAPDLGYPAILKGGTATDVGGLTRVIYNFETIGRVPLIAAADAGSVYDVPELGYLDDYAVDEANEYRPRRVPFHKLYFKGNSLPTGNVFNPIP